MLVRAERRRRAGVRLRSIPKRRRDRDPSVAHSLATPRSSRASAAAGGPRVEGYPSRRCIGRAAPRPETSVRRGPCGASTPGLACPGPFAQRRRRGPRTIAEDRARAFRVLGLSAQGLVVTPRLAEPPMLEYTVTVPGLGTPARSTVSTPARRAEGHVRRGAEPLQEELCRGDAGAGGHREACLSRSGRSR